MKYEVYEVIADGSVPVHTKAQIFRYSIIKKGRKVVEGVTHVKYNGQKQFIPGHT